MGNYISRTTKYDNKVVGIVETYKYVRATYGTNHTPKGLIIEDKKSEVNIQIHNQRIKMYATKDMGMVNNIDSIHENIWGQCKEPLQNMIKNLDEFTMKHKEK